MRACNFSEKGQNNVKKGKLFENLGKNVQNLKIFGKMQVIACDSGPQ